LGLKGREGKGQGCEGHERRTYLAFISSESLHVKILIKVSIDRWQVVMTVVDAEGSMEGIEVGEEKGRRGGGRDGVRHDEREREREGEGEEERRGEERGEVDEGDEDGIDIYLKGGKREDVVRGEGREGRKEGSERLSSRLPPCALALPYSPEFVQQKYEFEWPSTSL